MDEPQFEEPNARANGLPTAKEAAILARLKASDHRRACLEKLFENPTGLTDYELQDLTGVQQTSIGKRRLECQRAGLVAAAWGELTVTRRRTPSGAMAQVWWITIDGVDYLRALRRNA